MTTTILFKPRSLQSQWLLSLAIKPGAYRVLVAMNKLSRLYHQTRLGHWQDVLVFYHFSESICRIENYLDKEVLRLNKIIKRKIPGPLIFEPKKGEALRLKISTPVSTRFYKLLSKYDTLMCLTDLCINLNIFKKRRTQSKKHAYYSKGLLRLISEIGQYKFDRAPLALPSKEELKILGEAIQDEVMPVFGTKIFNNLLALSNSPIVQVQSESSK